MSRTIRSMQFIRSNAIASVALFVALGGSAYAADTVFSTDIVDGEVRSVDVEDNGLTGTDVASLGGADVTNESLTGARRVRAHGSGHQRPQRGRRQRREPHRS